MQGFEIELKNGTDKFEIDFEVLTKESVIEFESDVTEFEVDFTSDPTEFEITFEPKADEFEIDLSNKVSEIYPELEDITITPTTEEQNFKANKYGYNKVKVESIPPEYKRAEVIEKTLVLSRVSVNEGGLML